MNRQIETSDLTLKVFKCTKNLEEDHMREIFGKFGKIVGVKRAIKPETGMKDQIMFVQFDTWQDMELAYCSLNHSYIDGQKITIEFVQKKYAPINQQDQEQHKSYKQNKQTSYQGGNNQNYNNDKYNKHDNYDRNYREYENKYPVDDNRQSFFDAKWKHEDIFLKVFQFVIFQNNYQIFLMKRSIKLMYKSQIQQKESGYPQRRENEKDYYYQPHPDRMERRQDNRKNSGSPYHDRNNFYKQNDKYYDQKNNGGNNRYRQGSNNNNYDNRYDYNRSNRQNSPYHSRENNYQNNNADYYPNNRGGNVDRQKSGYDKNKQL